MTIKKIASLFRPPIRLAFLLIICAIALSITTAGVLAKRKAKASQPTVQQKQGGGETVGVPWTGEKGIQRTTAEIMQAQSNAPVSHRPLMKPEHEIEGRADRPQNLNAKPVASTPDLGIGSAQSAGNAVISAADLLSPSAPQPVSTNFDTVTGPTETGAFPPDTMGAAGPTQFFLFVNGRLRTFNKTTGVADTVVNADPDVFFASVMTPVGGAVVLNFTSDPQVRYDRLSGRWFLSIIDVPCANAGCTTTAANRWMVAVSDAASNGTISGGTVWTFYQFQTDVANFCDYPSLGVDSQALYTGCDMFTPAGAFVGTNGYVIRKTSVLSGGPLVETTFANLALGIGAGPFAPRGVDNYDPASNEGYFIGVDNATFGTLMIRRVSTPGGTPTISGNISLAVSTTSSSVKIDHLGNTGGTNGRIDTLDDRLYAAHIRNGRLWTAHNIRVDATGVANTGAQSREAVRWYELNGVRSTDNGGVPIVVQSGTTFDNAATLAASRQYSIPSVVVSGQGHAALGFTTTGTPFRIDAATNGRLVGDTLGTTQAVALYTSSSTAYNPAGDPGGAGGRRWGDYSFTSLDPLDDMSIWTVQEYCNGTNTYGARVAKLLAPPPATPATAAPASVHTGLSSVNVTITGTAVSGSGFYDPGANLAPPALPFTHISATVSGGVVVNSVTYTDPTHVTLNLNTTAAPNGAKDVTITNPDGQSLTGVGILTVTTPVTYTWNQTGSGAWTTSTNWTPTRTTPAADDLLLFNNAATTTATAVPTQTIGQLLVSGNTNVTLQAGAANTLTIAGDTGTDLSVAAGSQLNVNTATALIINVATGATGSVSGSMTLSAGAHRLTAVDASGITFNSGATFTEGTAFSGSPFGTTNLNSIVFASGSTFVFNAGSNPFGAGQPSSCVVFQSGSLFSQTGTVTPAFSGRTYADVELNNAAANITVSGGSAVSINKLTITAGTLNFNMTATPGHSIKGNVSIASGATLNFNPASAGTVNFNGTSAQTISGPGTLTFAALQTVNINNPNGVSLFKDVTLNGALMLTSGDLNTGANTLTLPAAATTGPATNATDVVGNLKRLGFVSGGAALSFGNPNNTIQINSGTAPTDITVNLIKASPQFFANAIRRTYTITPNGGSGISATVRFHYRDTELNGNNEGTLTAFRNDAGTWNNQGKSANFDDTVGEDNWVERNTVSTFSPWTLASATPTAAPANISGSIATAAGSPLAGATVRLLGARALTAITDGNGSYRFDNVDTDNLYTVTPESANYHFSPASRSFSLLANKTDALFTASPDAVASTNPIDTSEYFIRQHYLDFLGREPDAAGLNFWAGQLNQCNGDAGCLHTRRLDVSAAFFMSDEFQQTGSYVYKLYEGGLGRQSTYAEFAADRQQVVGSATLAASKAAFAKAFVARAEFAQRYQGNTTAESFVDSLLQAMNNRSGVDLFSERANLIKRYNSGSTMNESRALVVQDATENPAFSRAVYNLSFVLMEYYGYLQRDSDQGGYDFWLNVLNNRDAGNYRGMVCSFTTSAEYQRRFGTVITRSNADCSR